MTSSSDNDTKEAKGGKKGLFDRLKDVADENGTLNAAPISDGDFQEVLDLAKKLSSDGDLSDSDVDLIVQAVGEKDGILTPKQQSTLMDLVTKTARDTAEKKTSLKMRIFGVVSFVVSLVSLANLITLAMEFVEGMQADAFASWSTVELVLDVIYLLAAIVSVAIAVILGVRLVQCKRSRAGALCYTLCGITAFMIFIHTMLEGVNVGLILLIAMLVLEIVLGTYLHPSLANERKLDNKLLMQGTQKRAETGTLGRELDEKEGYIKLDFFNLFWIFIIGCVLGLIVEIIWHMVVVDPGVYQDRAGLLYGPFSPIYGVGCVLMTMALNRFKKSNIIFIFVVCTIIGGGFEYFVSWWMETAFGMKAWDYHGQFLGDLFDGRTCLVFASMFGALGTAWIKLLLPVTLRFINKIPWKSRYVITAICAVLMAVDCVMTVQAFDCWFERLSGKPVVTDVQKFYAEHYDNDYMANRFESITVNPDDAARS